MQYLSRLPEISSIRVTGDIIELEMEAAIGNLPDSGDDPVVLTGRYAGPIVVVVGQIIEYEDIAGPDIWCRLKIKGSARFAI